jgi:hypothetical protein
VLIKSGLSDLVADVLLGIDRMFSDSVLAETTTTVADLTGCAPRSVGEWLRENVDRFR